ncbi:23S rRNA (pseudouridine(1915)-N(3))-methyltransferase RlmH [Aquisalimonas sp. 2447]|uniref:23S rRNA (pseudouridine(1915)-N(3))-methyltransferase RlmH n=1 Tax=Aquisalimonas sp. 2447 TaxID=2740807 RepID=UPI00143254C4|nr:23S rRNA (pseudouridine(1915)-N(3))-methyltransferase RlmH [Aquisalimonas sp. 2447]QIT56325.1 23S rRNA (pseudouridine(1915)-N(3))-methyltransferase RlmH [Aquisalimonas sp. 2447]
MRVQLTAVGQKMPRWVADGYREYAGRMPRELRLDLRELPTGDRGRGGNPERAREIEGQRLLQAVPRDARLIALDQGGRSVDTEALAAAMRDWLQEGRDVALLVGGPDGLDRGCLDAAQQRWSLSPLTLPHMLVRVLIAEQLYRAWTMLAGHPYHR